MSNQVIRDFRREYPGLYEDLDDDQLTIGLGLRYPGYLENDEFRDQFNALTKQNRQRPSAAPIEDTPLNIAPEEQNRRLGLLGSLGAGIMEGMGSTGAQISALGEAGADALSNLRKRLGIKGAGLPSPIEEVMLMFPVGAVLVGDDTLKRVSRLFEGSRRNGQEFARDWQNYFASRGGSEFTKDLGAGAYSILPTIAASPTGLGGVVAAAGLQNFGATYGDAKDDYIAAGYNESQAESSALFDATVGGIKTSLITSLFGRWGTESITKIADPVFRQILKKNVAQITAASLPQGIRNALTRSGSLALHTVSEAAEEGIDEFLDGLLEMHRRNPNLSMDDLWDRAVRAAKVGGALGFGVSGVVSLETARAKRKLSPALQPFITDPNDPRLTGAFPGGPTEPPTLGTTPPGGGVPGPQAGPESTIIPLEGSTEGPVTQTPPSPVSEPTRSQRLKDEIASLDAQAEDESLGVAANVQAKTRSTYLKERLLTVLAEEQAEAELGAEGKIVALNDSNQESDADPYNPDPNENASEGLKPEEFSEEDLTAMELRRAIVNRSIQIKEENEYGRLLLFPPSTRNPAQAPDYENPSITPEQAVAGKQIAAGPLTETSLLLGKAMTDGSAPNLSHRSIVHSAHDLMRELTANSARPWRGFIKDKVNAIKEFLLTPLHADAREAGPESNRNFAKNFNNSLGAVPTISSEQVWAKQLAMALADGNYGLATTSILGIEDWVNSSPDLAQDYQFNGIPELKPPETIGSYDFVPEPMSDEEAIKRAEQYAQEFFPNVEIGDGTAKVLDTPAMSADQLRLSALIGQGKTSLIPERFQSEFRRERPAGEESPVEIKEGEAGSPEASEVSKRFRAGQAGALPPSTFIPFQLPKGIQPVMVTTKKLTRADMVSRKQQLSAMNKADLRVLAKQDPVLMDPNEANGMSKGELVEHIASVERQLNSDIISLGRQLEGIRRTLGDASFESTLTKFAIKQKGGNLGTTGEKAVAMAWRNRSTGQVVKAKDGESDISNDLIQEFPDVFVNEGDWEGGYVVDSGRFVSEMQASVDGVLIQAPLIRC